MEQIYLSRQADVVWRQIDEYGVLLKVNTGDYCELNEVGLYIWQQLEDEMSLTELTSRVAGAFEAPEETVVPDIQEFSRDLETRGMLVMAKRDVIREADSPESDRGSFDTTSRT